MLHRILTVLVLFLACLTGITQTASVALVANNSSDDLHLCYDIQIEISDVQGRLAAQNYRFYYDASALRFDRSKAISLVSSPAYNALKVLQVVHDSNASGYGNLDFSSNLGYVNMTITDDIAKTALSGLPVSGTLRTAEMCFERLTPSSEGDIIWARKNVTKGYASAFTELSLVKNEKTYNVIINDYSDIIVNKLGSSKVVDASNE